LLSIAIRYDRRAYRLPNDEHASAIERLKLVVATLRKDFGFPAAVIVDSGNGAQALFRYDLQNNDVTRDLCRAFLAALSRKFSDGTVTDPIPLMQRGI
jgi:hypothetical protein